MHSDLERLRKLAEMYNTHAEFCREAAELTVNPTRERWLGLAARWTRLAEEADARSRSS
jgi:hypothetical protein